MKMENFAKSITVIKPFQKIFKMLDELIILIKQTPPMMYFFLAGLILLISSYIKEERSAKGRRKDVTFADESIIFNADEQEDEHEFWKNCECPVYKEKEETNLKNYSIE